MAKQKKALELATEINADPLQRSMALASVKPREKRTVGPEEKRQRLEEHRTQGAKGCKAPRINVSFSQTNYDYVRIMSRIKGVTMCQFVNDTLTLYREEHPELFKMARSMIELVEADTGIKREE